MYEIIYLPAARQDITDIILYISDRLKAPKAAMALLDALDHSISLLSDFPYAHKLYRPVRSLQNDYRMLPVENYAVFYVVQEQKKIVEIHRVIYAKMDLMKLIESEKG
ncbi:MAG: type II toxin-antitoxin system RelE/ParE family toxin [Bacillota bacterium]